MMNKINVFNEYPPLAGFYVPSSWFVQKNNMFDVDPSDFKNIESTDELFLVKDHFFGEDLFISRAEYPLSTSENIIAVVSIGCRIFDEDALDEIPVCFYDVDFYFKKSGKGQPVLYRNESIVTNRFDAIKKASFYMKIFSHYIAPALSNKEVNLTSNLEEFINSIKYNKI
ncbi:hypothetical protein [Serratia sp. N21D137]|uniref:hypothetical protein n=1 Tax=Serratia sp. N21D137 TaxID=3397495 RepID=UPI0039E18BA1